MHTIKSLESHQLNLNFEQPIKFIKEGNGFLVIVNNYGELFIHAKESIKNIKKQHSFEISGMKDQFVKINEISNVKLIECGYDYVVTVNDWNEIIIFGNFNILSKYLQKFGENYFYKISKQNMNKNLQFKKVACGFDNIILVTNENILWVVGVNDHSQLGCDSKKKIKKFTKISTLQNVNIVDVKCGDDHTLILDDLGNVYGSGLNYRNALMYIGEERKLTKFRKLKVPFKVKKISCLSQESILVSTNNELYISFSNAIHNRKIILTDINVNYIYSSYLNPSIYLVTYDGKCYNSNYSKLDFTVKMECEDSYKDLKYLTVLPGNGIIVYSDYWINHEEDYGKNIQLFKRKLINCSLHNRVTDISFLI